jgi:hypothetical protein
MATRKPANPIAPTAGPTAVKTREMTLDFDGLMRILAQSLYSEKKVFIRELVQNAHDSVRRREKQEKNHNFQVAHLRRAHSAQRPHPPATHVRCQRRANPSGVG